MTRTVVTALALLLAFSVAACNNPDYSRTTVERNLTNDAGLRPTQARCLALGLESAIGVRRLGAREKPNPEERDLAHSALVYALLACSGAPFAASKVAHDLETQTQLTRAQSTCLVDRVSRAVGTDTLAQGATFDKPTRTRIRDAIVAATVACGGDAAALRRDAGLSHDEAACVVQRGTKPADIKHCTTPTTTTTTSTTTAIFGTTTTVKP